MITCLNKNNRSITILDEPIASAILVVQSHQQLDGKQTCLSIKHRQSRAAKDRTTDLTTEMCQPWLVKDKTPRSSFNSADTQSRKRRAVYVARNPDLGCESCREEAGRGHQTHDSGGQSGRRLAASQRHWGAALRCH